MLGLLAAETRLAGVFLLPALLVEFLLQARERATQKHVVAWLLLIPAGLLFYLSLNHTLFGDPLAFREIIDNRWQRELTWPGGSFLNSWQMIGTFPYGPFEFNRGIMEIVGGALFVAGTVAVLARLRFSYAVFTLLSAILVLSTSKLESVWRYMLANFPFFLVLGIVLAHSRVGRMLWWFISISLFIIFLSLFVSGQGGY
jgi:hypothetical protein